MASSVSRHQSKLVNLIRKCNNPHDLSGLIKNIDFGALQSFLEDYVLNQTTPESAAKIYHRSVPLPDITGTDCFQYMLSFLDYRGLCGLTGVSKSIAWFPMKQICKLMNWQLLIHPAFTVWCFGDWIEHQPRFALQHKYSFHDLNEYGFDKMGERGILKGMDLELWNICKHFGWKHQLLAYEGINCESDRIYQGPFCELKEAQKRQGIVTNGDYFNSYHVA